jgi:hypothetical protein
MYVIKDQDVPVGGTAVKPLISTQSGPKGPCGEVIQLLGRAAAQILAAVDTDG